jgi:aldehyde dehydrogenase (NAD+)
MKIETREELEALFRAQGESRWRIAATGAEERIGKLKRLRAAILDRREELFDAVKADFRKQRLEAWMTELYATVAEMDHAIGSLRRWMRDRRARGGLALFSSRSYLRLEPKGRVLIMSPWNYPFHLLMAPLAAAVAAGNVVIAKPSNKTPATSAFIASLIAEVFPPDEVAIVEGPGGAVGDLLLELPFDHMFFTGSPRIGVKVGEAAARAHAGATLELGGKSPTILLEDADLRDSARKVVWGKCLNAGQTCIAPDYVLCPRGLVDSFAAEAAAAVERYYGKGEEERRANPDLARIVDGAACARLELLVADAAAKGARIAVGGRFEVAERYASPTVLTGVTPEMAIMSEEIFGPILPILAYDSLDEALAFVRSRPKPLALYVFGRDRRAIRAVLASTTSGSACANNVILQVMSRDLPFGGVGMSGTGNYHGYYGFRTFSHERGVLIQGPFNPSGGMLPPYSGAIKTLAAAMIEAVKGMRPRRARRAASYREASKAGSSDSLRTSGMPSLP